MTFNVHPLMPPWRWEYKSWVSMDAGASCDWASLIERHRQRRAQDVPTVTVLAGDRRVGAWLWHSTPSLGGHASVVASGSERDTVLAQWLGGTELRAALHASILALMANDAGVSTPELVSRKAGRSPWQLEQMAERTAIAHELALSTVRAALGLPPAPAEPASSVLVLTQAHRLLGIVPPLLVDPDSASMDGLSRAAMMVTEFAEATPQADVGLLLGDISLDSLRPGIPDRVLTILREGVVHLREHGVMPQSAPVGVPVEYDARAFARSRAELTLFETLNARTRTHGVFMLNRKVDTSDGGAPLEVDLLAEPLKLALEVDGYHHFRDAHAYRRDRRKDVLLQHLGYVVLRVLAADVETELEHVVEIIDAAVERRRRSSA
jgi:very-short-patch-repair endonuclease